MCGLNIKKMCQCAGLAHWHIIGLVKKVPNTPLRPHILAAFLPWGGFAGAGRPARHKDTSSIGKKGRLCQKNLIGC